MRFVPRFGFTGDLGLALEGLLSYLVGLEGCSDFLDDLYLVNLLDIRISI